MDKVKSHLENVAVFGQGFVGLPLSLSFSFRGCNVYGVDILEKLVNETNKGITHHTECFEGKTIQTILNEELEAGRYRATADIPGALEKCNNIVLTVGMTEVIECCKTIGKYLKKGDLVLVRSTVVPGTTEDKVLPILEEESGMKAGVDFYLAYSSERIAEGFAFDEFAYMPTITAGVNAESAARAKELLEVVCQVPVIVASEIKIVETSKVFENVQRDVNIAMVQEFARFTEALGVSIHEVIEVANTHKRVNLLTPGPGVGGYCIPNAYHYIEPKATEMNMTMDILKLCREKNADLPNVMVNILKDSLKSVSKELSGAKVGVLGFAMKDYSNDDRISPPIEIIKLLIEAGAKVEAFDPAVPTDYDFKVDSLDKVLNGKDAIVVLAKQKQFDEITADSIISSVNKNAVVFDTRNLFKGIKDELNSSNIVYTTI
ncbi:nucleotide sugar dehydrogenase [Clostridium cylindrosporum]|uniref:UDP-N-acetyl-D-mannosamine dehydrogenase WecC n=1 Tax=Clostridium cylindrosporum DSM 605 TaxID=1121307 RepID=A0A0J8D996_CLOCY|nr:nucleotide sugar dehydrogenase [Clostridium cylindrosporum]KMT22605.1 UDP-N-acetyl-D-mannosamine dehydrogenase WecC [Clostridium cylindrosporum DSM 605]